MFSKPADAARALGVSRDYLRREACRGTLPEGSVISTPGGHHSYDIQKLHDWMLENYKRQTMVSRMENSNVLTLKRAMG